MRFAMICRNIVIEVIENVQNAPEWPNDKYGNPVTSVPCDDTVERGMFYNSETGTFSEYIPPEPVEPTPKPLTEAEERQIDILLNTEYIACLLESQLT